MIKLNYLPDWWWMVGAGVLAALLLLLSYALAVGRPSWWLRLGLLTMRWVVIAGVAFCLLDPHRLDEVKREQAAPVAVLLDCSRSMSIPDEGGARLDAARTWLQEQVFPRWPAGVPRPLFAFSQALQPLDSLGAASPTGNVTSLTGALEHLLAIPRDDPLAGVILCSDGIDTAQGDLVSLAKVYRRKGIPIYAASFGTRQAPRDVVLDNLQIKRAVPNQAPTRVGFSLRSPGFAGQSVQVQIKQRNQILTSQSVRLTGGEQRVEMDFVPRQKGYQVYEINIPVQQGEWLTSNNRRLFGLEVIDPAIRVIYMEGTPMQSDAPIPEWKYLKDALESDKNIKVTALYQPLGGAADDGGYRRTVDADPQTGEKIYPVNHPTRGFPRTMADLLKYDVIIHSDIKTQYFTGEQLQNMASFVEQHGGGYVMVGGNSAFGKGGYQKTIIDRIIPVAMQQYADSAKLVFQMQVPPDAYSHPVMAIGATRAETVRIWTEKLPVLYGFNRVDRAKPGAVVLATTPAQGLSYGTGYGQKVALAVQEIGKGRSMAFTSDTTRTWGADFETRWGEPLNPSYAVDESNCDNRYYRAFWINAVRWLAAGKVGKTNNAVTLELAQAYVLPGQSTSAKILVRDAETRQLAGADVALVLSAEGVALATNRASFDPATVSYRAELKPSAPGRFSVTALASLGGRKLGDDQQLLVCEDVDREMAEVRARPDVLAEAARLSGGKDLTENLDDPSAVASIFERVPPAMVSYRRTPLWDNGWWMAAIFALVMIEWVIRRLKGLA